MNPEIKVKKLHEDAVIPEYAHPGDAGMDLRCVEDVTVEPGQKVMIGTGLAFEVPEGFVPLFWDKSGLAIKHGLKILGGVFEYTYRGEYIVGMINLNDTAYEFKKGDKIVQLLIQPIATASIVEVEELSETSRGDGGFGSTGK